MKTITVGLIAGVVSLGIIQHSVDVSPAQQLTHWINAPSNLRQMNDDGTELEMLGVAKGPEVWLGASSPSQPFNGCDWWYRVEVEIRRAGEPFSYEPTHVGDWTPRSVSTEPLTYPIIRIDGLEPQTKYRWIARERVQPFTQFIAPDQTLCEPGGLRSSDWVWHHIPLDFSFTTR